MAEIDCRGRRLVRRAWPARPDIWKLSSAIRSPAVYPVSRSAAEVQGLKAYPSVDALPEPVDMAILIVPAEYVPAELERCGRAGIKAAAILVPALPRKAKPAHACSARSPPPRTATIWPSRDRTPRASPTSRPRCAQISARRRTRAPDRSCLRKPLGRGQVSVISQSGGVGFAFFDRARPRNLKFRYVVTTGNEAVLEISDFVDYMLDEGNTDVFLLLIEAVKTPEKFKRVAEKALKAGKPLIVGKIGQTEPGRRAVASHTAVLAGSQAAYRAIFDRYGLIEGTRFRRDARPRRRLFRLRRPHAGGTRVGICTASGGAGVWMADACAAAGLDVPVLDDATRVRSMLTCPPYGTTQNPVDSTAQGVQKLGYAQFARLVARSPAVDGVIVVITARRSAFLEADLPKLKDLARESDKPVFMWTYTLPAERTVEILNEAGYPPSSPLRMVAPARCKKWPISRNACALLHRVETSPAPDRLQYLPAALAAAPGV